MNNIEFTKENVPMFITCHLIELGCIEEKSDVEIKIETLCYEDDYGVILTLNRRRNHWELMDVCDAFCKCLDFINEQSDLNLGFLFGWSDEYDADLIQETLDYLNAAIHAYKNSTDKSPVLIKELGYYYGMHSVWYDTKWRWTENDGYSGTEVNLHEMLTVLIKGYFDQYDALSEWM